MGCAPVNNFWQGDPSLRSLGERARILARIPDLYSYRANLRDQRMRGVPQHQMVRKHAGQKQILPVAGPHGRCGKRPGVRCRLDRRNRNPHRTAKKTKALLFGQEEAAHPDNSACCREIDAPHPVHCARERTAARLQAVQEVNGSSAS
jgi:hypothetical protein